MTHRLSNLLIAILLLGFVTLTSWADSHASPQVIFEITEKEESLLLNGDIPVQKIEIANETYMWAAVVIDAAPSEVWEVMSKCKEVVEMVPQIRVCKIKEKKGSQAVIFHKVKLTSLLPSLSYSFAADFKKNRVIDFSFLQGDLKDLQGQWKILDRSNKERSWVVLQIKLSPGKMIPQGLVNSKLEKHLPKVLKSLKKRVLKEQS